MGEWCDCGVVGDGNPCSTCAAAPHHRECPCDECDAYWADVEARGKAALEAIKAGS